MKDKCEFYPAPEEETCVCGRGSDVSGPFVCTMRYSQACPWAQEGRVKDKHTKMERESVKSEIRTW